MLRELADVIARPFSVVFGRSWQSAEVPEDGKRADVTPIFKKHRKEDPGNYRLASFTSVVKVQNNSSWK